MQANRNGWIDVLKAGLIVLVVIGHVIPERMGQSPVRQWIYLFHMPAFLALSGYLLSDRRGVAETLARAWPRYVLPWIIATLTILVLRWVTEGKQAFTLVSAVIDPWYHLWYIPALLLFSTVYAATRQLGRWVPIMLLSLPMVLVLLGLDVMSLIGPVDARIITFGIYISAGIVIRHASTRVPTWLYILATLAGFAVAVMAGPRIANDWLDLVVKLLICTGLVGTAASAMGWKAPLSGPLSSESLAIYLWHAIALLYLKQAIPQVGLASYYLAALLVCLALLPIAAGLLRRSNIGRAIVGTT